MAILHSEFSKIDYLGPVPLVPFCAMRDSICLIPVVCKKQASQTLNQELLLWYGLASSAYTYAIFNILAFWYFGILAF